MKIKTSNIGTLFIALFLLISYQSPINAQSACVSDIETTEINGTTLHYIECGQGDPLIFVHGGLGDYRTWISQVGAFSEGYRVISYSRRYHYPNPWPQTATDFTVNIHAEDLASLIQTLRLDKVHLVGHSYGALTALLVGLNRPELVRSLTLGEAPVHSLLVSSPEGETFFENFMQYSINPSHAAFENGKIEDGVRLFIDGVLGEGSYGSLPPFVRIFMLENVREMKEQINEINAKAIDFFPSISCKDANQITLPTLLLDGERSPGFFRLINDSLDRCLPNNERSVISSASHDLNIQDPTTLSRVILPFLDKH